jgi:hypothetical protein
MYRPAFFFYCLGLVVPGLPRLRRPGTAQRRTLANKARLNIRGFGSPLFATEERGEGKGEERLVSRFIITGLR